MRGPFDREIYDPEVFDCGDYERLRQARRFASAAPNRTGRTIRRNR